MQISPSPLRRNYSSMQLKRGCMFCCNLEKRAIFREYSVGSLFSSNPPQSHSHSHSHSYSQSQSQFKLLQNKWRDQIVSNQNKPRSNQQHDFYYVLSMFPYPSGNLHMGHVRVYTISDVIARYKRLQGFHVLHPIGWDSFGLPAENAAIERNLSPNLWTLSNISSMSTQLKQIGLSFDWDKELTTSSPSYYRWTQWLFLQLYRKNVAYRSEGLVNWDPVDETVLADEQVDSKGCSWRSGARVEKKKLNQWYFRITSYADKLLEGLNELNKWPAHVLDLQKKWIGKKSNLKIRLLSTVNPSLEYEVEVMSQSQLSTASFIIPIISPGQDGPLFNLNELSLKVVDYCQNPITKQIIHIVSDAKTTHDNQSKKVYRLGDALLNDLDRQIAQKLKIPPVSTQSDDGPVSGTSSLANHDDLIRGDPAVSFHIRDWLVSRQRYWGTPIPIIHCKTCGEVPVPEEFLPVTLPPDSHIPLSKNLAWKLATCPSCGADAERETDTLDTFVDSSWYYLRFLDNENPGKIIDPQNIRPVDVYIGGVEHAKSHLLYSRFIFAFLMEHVFGENATLKSPFRRLITQGMVHGKTYKCPDSGKYLKPHEITRMVDAVAENNKKRSQVEKISIIATGKEPLQTWEKMSKSKWNGIDPTSLLDKYGMDVVRLGVLFKTTPDMVLDWNERDIIGQQRWINRLLGLYAKFGIDQEIDAGADSKPLDTADLCRQFNSLLKEYEHNIGGDRFSFNVCISLMMKFSNYLSTISDSSVKNELRSVLEDFAVLLYPFAPITACEIYSKITSSTPKAHPIHQAEWPRPRILPECNHKAGEAAVFADKKEA